MGTAQSTHTTMEISSFEKPKEVKRSESGRKQSNDIEEEDTLVLLPMISTTDDEASDDDASIVSIFDDEEEEDEGLVERRLILEDARGLAKVADFFLSPEKPMVSDATASARSFFSRYSAPVQTSAEDEVERTLALADADKLKETAIHYLCPELPANNEDPTLFGHNYFDSAPSVVPQDDVEEARGSILADVQALKELAVHYLNPEKTTVMTDFNVCGRNYFSTSSTEDFEGEEEMKEREAILADLKQLKQLAVDYLCPEKHVITSDPCACGRNYFSCSSTEEDEDELDMDERDDIIEEMKQLKKLATDFLCPELLIEIDPLSPCRNYFDRVSSKAVETPEEAADRAQIIADAQSLKKLAVDYLHPERSVVVVDFCAMGRNYFYRQGTGTDAEDEEEQERVQILADAAGLKKLAVDYLHPEMPVVYDDPCAMGRNYFTRPCTEPGADDDEKQELTQILADATSLKKLAVDYMHPELPVVTDGLATGRSYYSRVSATEYEGINDEQVLILEEMKRLKQLAVDFMHPERSVITSDPYACGSNFFSRHVALESVSFEAAQEEAQIMDDMAQLKKFSTDYLQPERPVKSNRGGVARNYFNRPSAPGHADHIYSQGYVVHGDTHYDMYYNPAINPAMLDHHHHHHQFVVHHQGDYHAYSHHHHYEDDHSYQSEHFDMDDEQHLQTFKDSLMHSAEFIKGQQASPIKEVDGEEGNLSRSPSSIMLFGLE